MNQEDHSIEQIRRTRPESRKASPVQVALAQNSKQRMTSSTALFDISGMLKYGEGVNRNVLSMGNSE